MRGRDALCRNLIAWNSKKTPSALSAKGAVWWWAEGIFIPRGETRHVCFKEIDGTTALARAARPVDSLSGYAGGSAPQLTAWCQGSVAARRN